MDLNINANALGLTPEDLRAEQDAANAERRRREQERHSILIDRVQMSADKADFHAIIDHVNRTRSQDFLSARPRRRVGSVSLVAVEVPELGGRVLEIHLQECGIGRH